MGMSNPGQPGQLDNQRLVEDLVRSCKMMLQFVGTCPGISVIVLPETSRSASSMFHVFSLVPSTIKNVPMGMACEMKWFPRKWLVLSKQV